MAFSITWPSFHDEHYRWMLLVVRYRDDAVVTCCRTLYFVLLPVELPVVKDVLPSRKNLSLASRLVLPVLLRIYVQLDILQFHWLSSSVHPLLYTIAQLSFVQISNSHRQRVAESSQNRPDTVSVVFYWFPNRSGIMSSCRNVIVAALVRHRGNSIRRQTTMALSVGRRQGWGSVLSSSPLRFIRSDETSLWTCRPSYPIRSSSFWSCSMLSNPLPQYHAQQQQKQQQQQQQPHRWRHSGKMGHHLEMVRMVGVKKR